MIGSSAIVHLRPPMEHVGVSGCDLIGHSGGGVGYGWWEELRLRRWFT